MSSLSRRQMNQETTKNMNSIVPTNNSKTSRRSLSARSVLQKIGIKAKKRSNRNLSLESSSPVETKEVEAEPTLPSQLMPQVSSPSFSNSLTDQGGPRSPSYQCSPNNNKNNALPSPSSPSFDEVTAEETLRRQEEDNSKHIDKSDLVGQRAENRALYHSQELDLMLQQALMVTSQQNPTSHHMISSYNGPYYAFSRDTNQVIDLRSSFQTQPPAAQELLSAPIPYPRATAAEYSYQHHNDYPFVSAPIPQTICIGEAEGDFVHHSHPVALKQQQVKNHHSHRSSSRRSARPKRASRSKNDPLLNKAREEALEAQTKLFGANHPDTIFSSQFMRRNHGIDIGN